MGILWSEQVKLQLNNNNNNKKQSHELGLEQLDRYYYIQRPNNIPIRKRRSIIVFYIAISQYCRWQWSFWMTVRQKWWCLCTLLNDCIHNWLYSNVTVWLTDCLWSCSVYLLSFSIIFTIQTYSVMNKNMSILFVCMSIKLSWSREKWRLQKL